MRWLELLAGKLSSLRRKVFVAPTFRSASNAAGHRPALQQGNPAEAGPPQHAGGAAMNLSREQFRELLIEALEDPAVARVIARRSLLPTFPIQGGVCDHTAANIGPGNFGDCQSGDYTFSTGQVGIGTSMPGYKLHVYGGPAVVGDSAGNLIIVSTAGITGGGPFSSGTIFQTDASNKPYAFMEGASTRMVIDSSGNVGIGTTSPSYKLDVGGDVRTTGSVLVSGSDESVVIGGTTTKQSSGGPEKVSCQDSDATKVALANFVGSEQYARLLVDMQGNHEWAGPSDVDQNVLLGWVSLGKLNVQGLPQGGFEVVSWKNTKLTNPINSSDTSIVVDDVSPFSTTAPNNRARCENELLTVTGINPMTSTLTVTRGVSPSTAVSHSAGTPITALGVPEAQPRVLLKVDGSGILFTDGVNSSDASISRPSTNQIYIQGDALLAKSGGKVGFYGTSPISKPTMTGSRGGNAALASLLTALSQLGLIVDNTSA